MSAFEIMMVCITAVPFVAILLMVGIQALARLLAARAEAKVVRNKGCLLFLSSVVRSGNKLSFWRSAGILQQRCAAAGHTTRCPHCGHAGVCSQAMCLSCSRYQTEADKAAESLCAMGARADPIQMLCLYRALGDTETMEDVALLLSGAEGIAIRPHEPEVPRNVLAARCFEVIKEKYQGLPFAVKWELASSTVDQQLTEQGCDALAHNGHTVV